jgi:hypothetical protein
MTPLAKALNGYLGWTMQHGPSSGTRHLLPAEYDLFKAVKATPEDDPFFDLEPQIRASLLECVREYERKGASEFTRKAYRSLIQGVQTLYTEKLQIRIAQNRQKGRMERERAS